MEIEFKKNFKRENMPNVLILLLDAFRADYLGCYGNPEGLSPNIDRIAKEGVLIERATTVAPWTGPSQATMFTGLYPNQHRCNWNTMMIRPGIFTIWDVFEAAGYHMVASLSNDKVDNVFRLLGDKTEILGWVTSSSGDVTKQKAREYAFDEAASKAPAIVKYFTDWLDRHKGRKVPFAAYLNVYDCHTRYRVEQPYKTKFLSKEDQKTLDKMWEMGGPFMLHFKEMNRELEVTPQMIQALKSQYKAQVNLIDDAVGMLLKKLAEYELLDNTIIVPIADHGDQLGDHRFPSFHHQSSIYNCLLWIAWIVRFPKKPPKNRRLSTPFIQNIDFMETVLDLCGIKKPDFLRRSPGVSLVPYFLGEKEEPPRNYGISMYETPTTFVKWNLAKVGDEYLRKLLAIWDRKYKLIFSDGGSRELYDIEVDWNEQNDIHEKFPDKCKEFEKVFYDILEDFGGIPEDYLVTAFSPETKDKIMERLRMTGYIPGDE